MILWIIYRKTCIKQEEFNAFFLQKVFVSTFIQTKQNKKNWDCKGGEMLAVSKCGENGMVTLYTQVDRSLYLICQSWLTLQPLPARRLIFRLLFWFSMDYVLTGQHLGCKFRAFCTFCTLMSRNISQEYSFFLQDIRSICRNIHLRNKISLHPIFNF